MVRWSWDSRLRGNDGANLLKTNKLTTKNYLGFSLVELMVVITILIILGTIAFMGFSSYTEGARDSVRVSDLAHISQGLEIHYADQGSYPMPSSASGVTFSGGLVWYQGTIGDDVISQLNGVGAKLSKKPTDPIYQKTEYTYSILANKKEYELGTAMEDSSATSFQSIVPQGYAADTPDLTAYTRGNYNGIVAKSVATGGTTYYLALPSIVLQDISTASARELTVANTQSGNLVLHSKSNIPSAYVANGITPEKSTIVYDRLRYSNDLRAISQGGSGIVAYALTGALTTSGAVDIMSGAYAIYTASTLKNDSSAPEVKAFINAGDSTNNLVTTYENIFDQKLGIATSTGSSGSASSSSYNVGNSLMFNGSNNYLSRTGSVGGNTTTSTDSFWVKQSGVGSMYLFSAGTSVNDREYAYFEGGTLNQLVWMKVAGGVTQWLIRSSMSFRDYSAWRHLVFVRDLWNGTSADRVRIYNNGVRITTDGTTVNPGGSISSIWGSATVHNIGRHNPTSNGYFDGYISDVNFVDSWALAPTAFGQFDSTTGQWTSKTYTGSYGTNGFHLDFSSGATAQSLWSDSAPISGGHITKNDWTVNNMSVAGNQMIDSPTNNFATLNPLSSQFYTPTFGIGNLRANMPGTVSAGSNLAVTFGTMAMNSGKWYWEVTSNNSQVNQLIGISEVNPRSANLVGQSWTALCNWNGGHVQIWQSGSIVQNPTDAAFWLNGIIGVALDMDNAQITFYSGSSAMGVPQSIGTGTYVPMIGIWSSSAVYDFTMNFWQGGQLGLVYNSNAGGYFKFAPPTWYKALSTANLPDPAIPNPKQYFDVLTWTGNGTNQTLSGLAFQPDFLWSKNRTTNSSNNVLADTMQGITHNVYSDLTYLGYESNGSYASVTPNGFAIGNSGPNLNTNSSSFVTWAWKNGSGGGSNVSGFDIENYVGNNGTPKAVNHSLWAIPSFILIKDRSGTTSWIAYHKSMNLSPQNGYLNLNGVSGFTSDPTIWNNSTPTSTTFTIWSHSYINGGSDTFTAYLWSEVPWFSKFGSYTGNGSTAGDGPFVYTGFKPRYIMIKRTDTAGYNWSIHDTARDIYNPSSADLFANLPNSEGSYTAPHMDILANGFKIRSTSTWQGLNEWNATSPATYIYAAFAEAPFKYATAR